MPLKLDRSYYSNLYEKFKQDHQTSGAFWSIKCRYVELYEYTMELEGQIAPAQPKGETMPMHIVIEAEELIKILEDHINEKVVRNPVTIENLFFMDGDEVMNIDRVDLELKPQKPEK